MRAAAAGREGLSEAAAAAAKTALRSSRDMRDGACEECIVIVGVGWSGVVAGLESWRRRGRVVGCGLYTELVKGGWWYH